MKHKIFIVPCEFSNYRNFPLIYLMWELVLAHLWPRKERNEKNLSALCKSKHLSFIYQNVSLLK